MLVFVVVLQKTLMALHKKKNNDVVPCPSSFSESNPVSRALCVTRHGTLNPTFSRAIYYVQVGLEFPHLRAASDPANERRYSTTA